ncbi:hypothetical protein ACSBR1_042533 [Camellia fascicularis]
MAVDPMGMAGGLLCVWNSGVFSMKACCSNRNIILLSGIVLSRFECVIANAYALNKIECKSNLWKSICNMKSIILQPRCLRRDFNKIKQLGERVRCSRRDRDTKDFNEFIESMEVTDLPMLGRKFIWCNAANGEKWSRIDRFLLSSEWLECFKFNVWGLPRVVSDHCLVLLMEYDRDWGPRPFKFINAWVLHPQFCSVVKKSWEEYNVHGRASFVFFAKLKALKLILKKWNIETFGNV